MENEKGKRVKDGFIREMITIDANASLEEAGTLMHEARKSLLVVTDNGRVVGVLTSGDWFKSFYFHVANYLPDTKLHGDKAVQPELQRARVENAKKRAAEFKQMKVKSIMNTHLKTIDENAFLIEAVREMKATDLRRLLVTNNEGKIIGVLGRTQTILMLIDELK